MKRTKKYQSIVDAFSRAKYYSIDELYARPSLYKTRAESMILQQMHRDNGLHYRVVGGSCHQFSCGYIYEVDDQCFLMYFTASNTYKVLLDQDEYLGIYYGRC